MIVLYMSGGLGNQLFNYAAARSLADRHGTRLVIDASLYRDQWGAGAERPILIQEFPLRAAFRHLGPALERRALPRRVWRRLREDLRAERVERLGAWNGPDPCWRYFPAFETIGGRAILRGYFINPRFFAAAGDRIRRDLTLGQDFAAAKIPPGARGLAERLSAAGPAVAVHVRRGDFLSAEWRGLALDNVDAYYRTAMAYFAERFERPRFWVFSNDIAWCKAEFADAGHDIRYVDERPDGMDKSLLDFYLMSLCDHQITANSSFSWWAAWLNTNPQKLVTTPARWDNRKIVPVAELVPAEWKRIDW